MYTTASVFFKTLAEVGITHAFTTWGSNHSAFLEDLHQQRAENNGRTLVEIVTCPSQYVALSAAHGYARVTKIPAVVIVDADMGTQALAGAVHNADRGQIPVLIFAGSAPFTSHGELRGSKNEFTDWLEDAHDQAAIVRQYMRYTAQIQSGKHASKMIMRALQIATSEPKGPVYLWASREVMYEDVDEITMNASIPMSKWPAIAPPALSSFAVERIVSALVQAEFPLIIASNTGHYPPATHLLASLSSTLAIGVLSYAASVLSVPFSHPYNLGHIFAGKLPHIADADFVLVLNADVPWIDVADNGFRADVKIFVIDNDPLKRTFVWSHVDAEMLCAADSATALSQILTALRTPDGNGQTDSNMQTGSDAHTLLSSSLTHANIQRRREKLGALRATWLAQLSTAETQLAPDSVTPSVPFLLGTLREAAQTQTPSRGGKVLWLHEAASASGLVWNHIAAASAGSMYMSGGSSLGWVLGASIGASIGGRVAGEDAEHELLVAITGDGNFLFGAPTAAYWVARRYETPFLTVVVNNRGWASLKISMRGVHPAGHGSLATGERLSVGFGEEDNVDYGGVAASAGGAWTCRVECADELKGALEEGMRVVMHERRCAVVECIVESI